MCFAPQPRALFRHLNCQKLSKPLVFNMLTSKYASRHNGVHFFDISISKNGPRMGCFVHWTSKFASRHNGVRFFDVSTSKSGPNLVCFVHFDFEMCFAPQPRAIFISHLASWLRTCRFSEPIFRPPGDTNRWKNMEKHSVSVFRDFPTFSRACIFFLLILSLL